MWVCGCVELIMDFRIRMIVVGKIKIRRKTRIITCVVLTTSLYKRQHVW